MRTDVVVAQNFMNHRETVLDFTIGERVQIDGVNGTGKTSGAVDAPLWALFGKGRGSTLERVKGKWSTPTSVCLRFAVNGKDYEVKRTIGSKTALEMTNLTDGVDMTEKHVAMTQAKITDLLGSYSSFVNTAVFKQGDALRFGLMKPEERRTLFEELLELEIYADIETRSNRGRSAARNAADILVEKLSQMAGWEADLADARAEEVRVTDALKIAQDALDDEQAALDSAQDELLSMNDANEQRQQQATLVSEIERTKLVAQAKVDYAKSELARLDRTLVDLKVSICPTCKQELNADEVQRQTTELLAEEKRLGEEARTQQAVLDSMLSNYETEKAQLDKIDTANAAKFQHAKELQRYASAKLPELRIAVAGHQSALDRLTGSIKTLDDNLAPKDTLEAELADQQHRIRGYELISEGFSKRGIPRELMRGFALELEKATNALLSALGGMSLEIKLDKEGSTKHGVTEGTVEVWYSDASLPTRPVEMLSGGEKMRAMTALRLGIAQAMARRTDKSVRTLILDESLDGLDQRGKDEMMTMLGSFSSTAFDRMLIVTHDPAVSGLFTNRITLVKDADGAAVVA